MLGRKCSPSVRLDAPNAWERERERVWGLGLGLGFRVLVGPSLWFQGLGFMKGVWVQRFWCLRVEGLGEAMFLRFYSASENLVGGLRGSGCRVCKSMCLYPWLPLKPDT